MKNIKREFFVFNTDSTLVLENPLSVEFINGYNGIAITNEGEVTINNSFVLVPYWKSLGLSGSALLQPPQFASPYFLTLNNNSDEQDTTQYTIRFNNNNTGNRLFVIVKYRKV
tara:strand:- start:337 stop:675 length:339 start_codon:yes stop_codon:yes gene_type:complete